MAHSAAPIHFVENEKLETLELLLLKCNQIDVDFKNRILDVGRKNGYEDMIKHLLKAGYNPNSLDLLGNTSIRCAAELRFEDFVNIYNLFEYLFRYEDDEFVIYFTKLTETNDHLPALTAISPRGTLLQVAAYEGQDRAVKTLLEFKADPNATCSANTRSPIALACERGYARILERFMDNKDTLFDPVLFDGESLLQIAIKGMRFYHTYVKANFDECIRRIMEDRKFYIDVNYTNLHGNTALHYLGMNYIGRDGNNDIVLYLLRNGACVGLRNKYNEPPLADINPNTLETYLDECITTNSKMPSDDDYKIRMNYSFLVYPNNYLENEPCKNPLMDNSGNKYRIETDALLYMASNEELRPLLIHPVLTSFLYLKWQRLRWLFYADITFYSFFWLLLILYTILGHSFTVVYVGAWVCLILLILRELFQSLLSPARYFRSIENWMEIMLIIMTTLILSYNSAEESTKQQLSAIAILLSSAELVLLIGQFPTLSTNIVMLKTVTWNFLSFLLFYCILIIAFALSFYTLFRHQEIEEHEDQKAPNPKSTGNEDFFEDPARSLFKTIVMMTGEFEAGSIKFSTFPVTSHIIFILFVFMIPIVLFNLLNGLAVSDTLKIRADAELVSYISQIKLICYIERQLVAYSYPSKILSYFPEGWQKVLLDIRSKYLFMFCIKPLAKRIRLLPQYLARHKIIVKPNQSNKIIIPDDDDDDGYNNVEGGGCCFKKCQTYRLDKKIVQDAKVIIAKKKNVTELNKIKLDKIVQNKKVKYAKKKNVSKLNKIKKKLSVCDNKLDSILKEIRKLKN